VKVRFEGTKENVGSPPGSPLRSGANDPLYSEQYYLHNTSSNLGSADVDIDAPQAWNHTRGNSSITVAVIDEGVGQHEDFYSGQLVNGKSFGDSGGGSPNESDENHGQPVAGIVAANHNNGGKVRGVAPNVKMMPISIADVTTPGQIEDAIDYAWQNGADVLNNSYGTDPNNGIASAIGRARQNGRNGKGSVVVKSAGNEGNNDDEVTFPGGVSGVLAVGAVDKDGNKWYYTPDDSDVDVIAPSGDVNLNGDVRTTDRMGSAGYEPENYTSRFGGTSAAAPQASGVAALMLSIESQLSESKVRQLISNNAVDYGSSDWSGDGLLNAVNAVTEAAEPAAPTNLTITNADQTGQHPNLDWDDNSEPDIDHYNVERCTSYYTSCNWSKIAETTTSDYTDTWVSTQDKENADHEYTYQVLAVDTDSYSSFPSNLASVWGVEPHSFEPQHAEDPAVPDTFALRAPTPNPTADRARLQVHVPEARTVTIVVHDLMGREVARLADRRMRPGIHPLTVQARQWPSAVYLVRMRAGQFSATERLTVVR
jgi:hypothetical protein